MFKIQSIIFDKEKNNIEECISFILDNNFKINKIDETAHYYRFRQISPKILKKEGFTHYRTKLINDKKNIYYIIAYKDDIINDYI